MASKADRMAGTFTIRNRRKFRNWDNEDLFFIPAQRNLLVYHVLNETHWDRNRPRADAHHQIGHDVTIEGLLHFGIFTEVFPPHDGPPRGSQENVGTAQLGGPERPNERLQLHTTWSRFRRMFLPQPFDHIRHYFGEMVGFYFVWLSYYTRWLIFPAIIGLLIFIYGLSQLNDYVPAYAAPRGVGSSACTVAVILAAHPRTRRGAGT